MLPLLLKTYSIDNVAENESLHIALTTDDAKITNNLNYSIVGLKMIDRRCKDPITKKYCSPQSRNMCWPLKIIMEPENKEMYTRHIIPAFNWWNKTNEEGENLHFRNYKPFQVTHLSDMLATWKLLGISRAAKVKDFFYHCYDTQSQFIHHANPH